MKFWGAIVAVLYVLILFVLSGPLFVFLWYPPESQSFHTIIEFYTDLMKGAGIWSCVAVALIAQAALLSIPIENSLKRPTTKRTIIPVVLATAFAVGILIVAFMGVVNDLFKVDSVLFASGYKVGILLFLFLWLIWGVIFFRWGKNMESKTFIERQCPLLFKGSIIELLIAVPSHIIVRQRDECCAGILTGIGIALGLAVMLFSFGPGVYYLFVDRIKRLQK